MALMAVLAGIVGGDYAIKIFTRYWWSGFSIYYCTSKPIMCGSCSEMGYAIVIIIIDLLMNV